jgi:RNA polymerase sigma factor (sigma-70 family)
MEQQLPEPDDGRSDDELVALTLSGERQAFGELWDRHHRRVFGYGYRCLGHPQRAEDVTAEAFRRALASLRTYRGPGFRSWLFAIAHNVMIDEIRVSRPLVSLDTLAERRAANEGQGDRAIERIERDVVTDLLPRLAAGEREVIELRLAGLGPAEIALVLGKTRPAVDMAYHRALVRLRTLLGLDNVSSGGHRDA